MKRGNRLTWAIWTFLEMCSETYSPSEATHELRQPASRTALTQVRPEEALGRSPPSSLGAHVHAGPFAVFPSRLVLCNSGNASSAFPHIHDACDLLRGANSCVLGGKTA